MPPNRRARKPARTRPRSPKLRAGVASPRCAGGCSPGIAAIGAICPGGDRAIRIASGSARSCSSRRKSPRSSRITSGFWPAFPTFGTWPRPTSMTCCGIGKAWAITAGPGNCTGPPGKSSSGTTATFPPAQADVERLAGIGRYTAGAILSIALDQPEPILEANTVRLHSRLLAIEDDPTSRAAQKRLWQFAAALLPRRGAGELNQALMELGSLVCTPQAPRCGECPLAEWCLARARGPGSRRFRGRRKKSRIEAVREAAAVVWRGRASSAAAPSGRRTLGRPVGFSPLSARRRKSDARGRRAGRGVADQTGLTIVLGEPLATIRHSVTRFRITLDVFHARRAGGAAAIDRCAAGELRWPADRREIAAMS